MAEAIQSTRKGEMKYTTSDNFHLPRANLHLQSNLSRSEYAHPQGWLFCLSDCILDLALGNISLVTVRVCRSALERATNRAQKAQRPAAG